MSSITILFATEMGNSETCADYISSEFEKRKLSFQCMNMKDFDQEALPSKGLLLIITSTTGDGDPPNDALELYDCLTDHSLDMSARTFAVLALGDSSYPNFAQCGRDFDRMLGDLGAKRVIDRIDCDVDYEEPSQQFCEQLFAYFATEPEQFPDFLKEEPAAAESAEPEASEKTESALSEPKDEQESREAAGDKPSEDELSGGGRPRSLPRRLLSRVKNKVLTKIKGGG